MSIDNLLIVNFDTELIPMHFVFEGIHILINASVLS